MAAYTAENVSEWLLALRPKLKSISKKNLPYGSDDVRHVTFYGFENIVIHFSIINNMFSAFEKGIVADKVARSVFGFSIHDPHYADTIENMGKFEKISFTILTNFNAEVICKVILQHLTGQNVPDGFRQIIEALIRQVGLSDPIRKTRDLYTMALIRNALHSNGVHTKRSIPPYVMAGYTFEFQERNPVECATWRHLIAAFEGLVDILDEIVDSPTVKAITTQLPWQYTPL